MVSFNSLALTASSLAALPSAMAMINGMTAPSTAKAGSTVSATLTTSIYIQNWDDFGIIWGLGRKENSCGDCVGPKLKYTDLVGPDAPDVPDSGSFEVDLTIPNNTPAGEYLLTAGIPHLVGASGLTGINYFNATITVS